MKIVKGNDFLMKISISKLQTSEDFDLTVCEDVRVGLTQSYYVYDCTILQIDKDVVYARVEGDKLKIGTFNVAIKGKYNSNDWRFTKTSAIEIVEEATTDDEVSDPSKLKEIEITVYYNYNTLPTSSVTKLSLPADTTLNEYILTDILPNIDVSNATTLKNFVPMYDWNSESLTSLDVSNWDVSNVTDMNSMFWNSKSLTSLDVSNWDVSNVTDMNSMFANCESLTSLDVSNWDVSNVTDMNRMFANCESLTSLDLSKWKLNDDLTSLGYMLSGIGGSTSNGTVLDITGVFDGVASFTGRLFYNSKISSLVGGRSIDEVINNNIRVFTLALSMNFTDYEQRLFVNDRASWRAIINGLYDYSNKPDTDTTNYTLTLFESNYNLLTEDDIKVATDKGWTIIKS